MNPLDELKAEHRGIESALSVLEKIADRIDADANSDTIRDAESLIDFFKVFADTCHHGKEEKVLFPALEQVGVLRQGGPIGVMLTEHDDGRNHISGMTQALKELREDIPGSAGRFRGHADSYIKLLRAHIQKEDQVLFQMADERLPEDRARDLSAEFDRIEHDVVGEGKHDEYHAMLDAFTKKYGI